MAAKRWFESTGNWLLILDNVEDWGSVREWIPRNFRGHVLITTRLHFTGTYAVGLDLPKLTVDEGVRFLLARGKFSDPSDADVAAAGVLSRNSVGYPWV